MDTRMSYEQLRTAADDVKNYAAGMETIFNDFSKIMIQLADKNVFEGVASQELQLQFDTIKGNLHVYTETVEEFSKEMLHAADTTQDTETTLKQNAANLPGIQV